MLKLPRASVAVVYLRPVSVFVAVMVTPGSGTGPDLTAPRMVPPLLASWTEVACKEVDVSSGCPWDGAGGWPLPSPGCAVPESAAGVEAGGGVLLELVFGAEVCPAQSPCIPIKSKAAAAPYEKEGHKQGHKEGHRELAIDHRAPGLVRSALVPASSQGSCPSRLKTFKAVATKTPSCTWPSARNPSPGLRSARVTES